MKGISGKLQTGFACFLKKGKSLLSTYDRKNTRDLNAPNISDTDRKCNFNQRSTGH
jgi:hypothetical protein